MKPKNIPASSLRDSCENNGKNLSPCIVVVELELFGGKKKIVMIKENDDGR
jgi:hypothetical protein